MKKLRYQGNYVYDYAHLFFGKDLIYKGFVEIYTQFSIFENNGIDRKLLSVNVGYQHKIKFNTKS